MRRRNGSEPSRAGATTTRRLRPNGAFLGWGRAVGSSVPPSRTPPAREPTTHKHLHPPVPSTTQPAPSRIPDRLLDAADPAVRTTGEETPVSRTDRPLRGVPDDMVIQTLI